MNQLVNETKFLFSKIITLYFPFQGLNRSASLNNTASQSIQFHKLTLVLEKRIALATELICMPLSGKRVLSVYYFTPGTSQRNMKESL